MLDSRLATQVLALRRRGLAVAQIARELGRPEAEIMDAHRMLGIPIADRDDTPADPDDAERAAERDRWPRKMQERWEKQR